MMSWLPILIKADVEVTFKYRIITGYLISMVLLLLNPSLYSQKHTKTDTVFHTIPPDFNGIPEEEFIFDPYNSSGIPEKLRPPSFSDNDRNPYFFDSLKVKASRRLITKKLYDFIVVSKKPSACPKVYPGTIPAVISIERNC